MKLHSRFIISFLVQVSFILQKWYIYSCIQLNFYIYYSISPYHLSLRGIWHIIVYEKIVLAVNCMPCLYVKPIKCIVFTENLKERRRDLIMLSYIAFSNTKCLWRDFVEKSIMITLPDWTRAWAGENKLVNLWLQNKCWHHVVDMWVHASPNWL